VSITRDLRLSRARPKKNQKKIKITEKEGRGKPICKVRLSLVGPCFEDSGLVRPRAGDSPRVAWAIRRALPDAHFNAVFRLFPGPFPAVSVVFALEGGA